jgi:hypothetical protein
VGAGALRNGVRAGSPCETSRVFACARRAARVMGARPGRADAASARELVARIERIEAAPRASGNGGSTAHRRARRRVAVGARWCAMGHAGLAVGPQRPDEGRVRVGSRPRANAWMRATELTGERATVRTRRGDLTGDLVLSHLARKRAARMNDVCVFSSAAPRPSRWMRASITLTPSAVLGLSQAGRRRASRACSGLS